MANGDVTAEQVDRLIAKVEGLVSALDAIVLDRRDYIDAKDLAMLAMKVSSAQEDIDDMRQTLSRVVFLVVGAGITFLFGLLTVVIYGAQGGTP